MAGIEGLEGRLIPPALMIQEYFATEQKPLKSLEAKAETLNANMEEMREEHGGEEGLLSNTIDDKGKISKANLGKAIKELGKRNEENAEEFDMLAAYKKPDGRRSRHSNQNKSRQSRTGKESNCPIS